MELLLKLSDLMYKYDTLTSLQTMIKNLSSIDVSSKDCHSLLLQASLKRDFDHTIDWMLSTTKGTFIHAAMWKLSLVYSQNLKKGQDWTEGMPYTTFRNICWSMKLLPQHIKEADILDVYKYLEVDA